MHSDTTVKLRNVNIQLLTNLINQSLMVSPQLMFEFSQDILKSVNFSSTGTFMKIWVIEIEKLLKNKKEEIEEIESLETPTETLFKLEDDELEDYRKDFDKVFNFYLLKGEQLKNVLNTFKNDTIDIEFLLVPGENGYQAKSLIIDGLNENDRPLKISLTVTVEAMITNKISDYDKILEHCKPKDDMVEISFTDNNVKELKKLISTLHKTMPNNSSFVTFKVDENFASVNDKVFNITFDDLKISNLTETLEFNMLKSDFSLIGNQSFKIYTSYENKEIHIGASYNSSIIYCITAKAISSGEDILSQNDNDDILTSADLAAYDLEDL